jgi:hypothetical protein
LAVARHIETNAFPPYLEWCVNYLMETAAENNTPHTTDRPDDRFELFLKMFKLQLKLNSLNEAKMKKIESGTHVTMATQVAPYASFSPAETKQLNINNSSATNGTHNIRKDYEERLHKIRTHYEQEIRIIHDSYSWKIGSAVINFVVKYFSWTPMVKKHL